MFYLFRVICLIISLTWDVGRIVGPYLRSVVETLEVFYIFWKRQIQKDIINLPTNDSLIWGPLFVQSIV